MNTLAALLVLSCGDRDADDTAEGDGPCLLVDESTDWGSDGEVDNHIVHTYDASGRRLTSDYDDDPTDGVVEWHYAFLYDANGLLVVEEIDAESDGSVDARLLYTHDEANRVVFEVFEYDGYVQTHTQFAYDWEGRLLTEEDLDVQDGRVIRRVTYVYDAEGLLLRQDDDWNADGTVNSVTDYLYAGPGWCAGMVRSEDGEVVTELGFSIDEAGDAVVHSADSFISSTYRYDARGHVYEIDSVNELTHEPLGHTDVTWECPAQPHSECLLSWPTCEPDGTALPLLPRCGT